MDSLQTCRWHEYDSRIHFEQAACRFILASAEQAITARGAFRIVLSGGNTPRHIYRALSQAKSNWSAWHIYFGDERCLPADDPERNSLMAFRIWLGHVPIPSQQIHLIQGELGPEKAAISYSRELAGAGEFDLVVLGLGEDGHTASLFPDRAWEHMKILPAVLPVFDSPKPPLLRVTLSPARLSHTLQAMFLVFGKEKQEAVKYWRTGKALPASRIRPANGVDIFLHTG